MKHTAYHTRRGISMAETVVASLLVGTVLASTIQIVGPVARSSSVHADRLIAANLANELTEEIATRLWTDPDSDAPDSIGSEGGETRIAFDDVDDYHGWSASPPQISSGTAIPSLTGWTRTAAVDHADINNPSSTAGAYTGLKRVTVRVSKNGTPLAEVVSLHAHGADTLGFVVSSGGS